MPNYELQKRLRPVMSHDDKNCRYDVTQKKRLATKTVIIQGYATFIFASAKSNLDMQDSSRTFLLSPQDNPEKIKEALELQNRKDSDAKFREWYENDTERVGLRVYLRKIKNLGINRILFENKGDLDDLLKWFKNKIRNLTPKAMRDYPRLKALAKAWCLFNWQHRRIDKDLNLYANKTDIEVAKQLYEPLLESSSYGLSPDEWEVYQIIKPQLDIDYGLSIREIHDLYFQAKKRRCSDKRLRGMLKNFCQAGLLREEKDKGKLKYYPIIEEPEPESKPIQLKFESEK